MKTKKLALLSFFIPFARGGGLISSGTVLDRLAKPDTDEYKILIDGFLDLLCTGSIFGTASSLIVLTVAAIASHISGIAQNRSNK